MTESKESKSSKIAVGVIVSVLSVGVLWLLSRIPGLFHWLGNIGVALWTHLKGTSGLPNWGLYLLVLAAIHTAINLIRRLRKPKGPNVTAYTQDTFLGLIWRWSYISNHPHNPWAFCPYCDTMLIYSEQRDFYSRNVEHTMLTCETCNREMLTHEGDKDYLVNKILRQIDRIIRTGEWKTKIKSDT
jgi:hypothetical protein